MGRNVRTRKAARKLGRHPKQSSIGQSARKEWRQFISETPTAKFYALGFCILSGGIALGILSSSAISGQRDLRLGNLMLVSGGYAVLCKLKRLFMGRRPGQ
jgi:hypothetical protein